MISYKLRSSHWLDALHGSQHTLRAECFMRSYQARNQLGTLGGAQSFLRGTQIFETMPNSFKICPTHFSRGGEKFSRRGFAPLRPLVTGLGLIHTYMFPALYCIMKVFSSHVPLFRTPIQILSIVAFLCFIDTHAGTNRLWPPLRPVSVAQKNKLSTMLSSNVQSIDLPMDCMA